VSIQPVDNQGKNKLMTWRCTNPGQPWQGLKGCPDGYSLAHKHPDEAYLSNNMADTCIRNDMADSNQNFLTSEVTFHKMDPDAEKKWQARYAEYQQIEEDDNRRDGQTLKDCLSGRLLPSNPLCQTYMHPCPHNNEWYCGPNGVVTKIRTFYNQVSHGVGGGDVIDPNDTRYMY
jgi:hypothetical protein